MSQTSRRTLAAAAALSLLATMSVVTVSAKTTSTAQTYLVLAPEGGSTSKVVRRVVATGGTVLARYDAIGVILASSRKSGFAASVLGPDVESAATTSGLATRVELEATAVIDQTPDPETIGEPLWAQQWDMRAIMLAEAHSITIGSADVIVGVLDTGIDDSHPDLASQVDDSLSVSCVGGVPNSDPAAWRPSTSDHGTHVAGTLGAARNDLGIVGVAPGVRLASVKVVNDDGFIYPEAALCGYMWAADHGFDVTNNSYFIDPWEFNCRNDPRQRPVWAAVQRALRYATTKGVVTVASAGNSQYDLQHKNVDAGSPNDGSGSVEERLVNSACMVLPGEAPGVVTVSATGPTGIKSFYSSYGLGVVEVAAPGGDSRVPGSEPNGRVFSTIWPGNGYGYKQGTSMAAPHVAGLAALIRSLHPDLSPAAVTEILERSADPRACPDGGVYVPPGSGVVPQYCYGSTENNGFYGHGEVNAYRAVTD